MKQDELEKLGVVGVNYGSQEPITLQLRLNYAFFAPKDRRSSFFRHHAVRALPATSKVSLSKAVWVQQPWQAMGIGFLDCNCTVSLQ